MTTRITILGAGSWGLTLAWLLAGCPDKSVCLWDRNSDKIATLQANRTVIFPVEVTLPEGVVFSATLNDAVANADIILMVVSSAGTRTVAQQLKACPNLPAQAVIVNASKGIDYPSLEPLSHVIAQELPDHQQAVLSGPTLAKEILKGLPTACTVASPNLSTAEYVQQQLSKDHVFRVYSNTDVVGVELGGALKNVFAIASGYIQAKQLGENAKSAFITRGLAEMTRFCMTMGAEQQTLFGLSGLGDLLATCNSPLSRNFQVGFQLAEGLTVPQILEKLNVVAEGVQSSYAVSELAKARGIDMPIVTLVGAALQGEVSMDSIIKNLMGRKLKSEKAHA